MKKKINKPMRAAGILLVATMLTTCMTAGTFAKYTTSDSATDTARVAKFGVNINVNGYLFGKEYAVGENVTADDGGNKPITYSGIYDDVGTGSVQVYFANGASDNLADSDTDNVVAPGTMNDTGLGFSISGKPEVDCRTTIDLEAKNVYLAAGSYATMESIKIETLDDLNHAVATYGADKLYLVSDPDDPEWELIDIDDGVVEDAVYFKIKDVVDADDFEENGIDEAYFPVIFALSAGDNDDINTSAEYDEGDYKSDSLKAALQAIADNAGPIADKDNENENTLGYYSVQLTSAIQEANRAFDVDAPNEVLTWEWPFVNGEADDIGTFTDKLDTILGNLVAQDSLAEANENSATNPFIRDIDNVDGVCRVVKLNGTNYVPPTPAATDDAALAVDTAGTAVPDFQITEANDYNLWTGVYLKATVTQVD